MLLVPLGPMRNPQRRPGTVEVSMGFVGASVIILAIVMAIAEGYISDAEHTTGNLAPSALTGLFGACLMLVGFGSILFRRE
ncbi:MULTISPECIES: hypothetical protein [unclassified Microbacterium]|uniref:hypothetical protein n=1 Tax=unclassified Microbacterium TaxID=2609290 RepID=UPI00109C5E0D|nr:hypothetical protein [Microbacterium sp. K36]